MGTAGGAIFLNDRTVLLYSMRETDGCWMLEAVVLLRGRAPKWYFPDSNVQRLRRPLFPSGNSTSVGNYFVSVVTAEREVWIDRTTRFFLEDSNVLLLDEADNPIAPPVVLAGTILNFTPAAGQTLSLTEYGTTEGGFIYHDVFTQGGFAFDPRYNSSAVPLADYLNYIGELNPGVLATPR
jgi:hypothetical protein